ncbi:WVD2-like protein 4 [Tanacetum coccineum]
MAEENYVEGCFMQRPPLIEACGFCFRKIRFETCVKETCTPNTVICANSSSLIAEGRKGELELHVNNYSSSEPRHVDMVLHSDVRAVERSEFDQQVQAKLSYIEQYKLEREKEQKLEEEEELKRLRKELIPIAQPMPYFDRPFIPKSHYFIDLAIFQLIYGPDDKYDNELEMINMTEYRLFPTKEPPDAALF